MPSGILLVEDDAEDQFIFCDAMASLPDAEKVHCVIDGTEALRYLSSLPQGQMPCVIVADLNMPRMNGSELLQQLKKHDQFCTIPMVMYTTSINRFEKEACLRMGAHSYITKPLTHRESLEVAQMVKNLCRELQEDK